LKLRISRLRTSCVHVAPGLRYKRGRVGEEN
jgi:hypothetical protein